jgi:hypothetical protein
LRNASDGLFYLTKDMSPREVAEVVYGDGSRYLPLLRENDHSTWGAGETVVVPNKKGRIDTWGVGEAADQLVQRMFPGQPAHLFVGLLRKWNGDESREGAEVFVPER